MNLSVSRTSVCAQLRDVLTYTAIVNCLCNFLEEHREETTTADSPILPKTRPLGEKKALQILNVLLPGNIPGALEAGLVSRWLSKYPFPCASFDPPRRQYVVVFMKTWWSDDAVMSSIFSTLTSNPDAIKQLRNYGLMGSMIEENDRDDQDDGDDDDYDDADSDVWMVDGDDTAGQTSSRRLREESAEEQALRRRRREAMVLSEGGRPLGSDDIIQRPIQDD